MTKRRHAHGPRLGFAIGLSLVVAIAALALPAHAQFVALPFQLEVDVPAVEADGDFTLDGGPTPTATAEYGQLALDGLFGPETETPIGRSFEGGWGPTSWIPGTYARTYQFRSSLSGDLPRNTHALVGPTVHVDGTAPIDFDITTVEVTLDLTIDGAAPPSDPGESAIVSLRDRTNGDEFEVGRVEDAPLVFRVVPGVYDVIYAYASGVALPLNTHAVILANATFESDATVMIDLETVVHTVSATLDGTPFPASAYERGEISLEDPESGDVIDWGDTSAPAGFQRILSGTYDVVYRHAAGNSIVPANERATVATDLSIEPPSMPNELSFSEIDIESHALTLEVLLDGQAFPLSAYEFGDLVLVGEAGDVVHVGGTHEVAHVVQVVGGRYDLHYRHVAGNQIVPWNKDVAVASGIRVTQDASVDVAIETIEIQIEALLDGQPFPASAYERGDLTLLGALPNDRIEVGSTSAGAHTVRLAPGYYDLEYDHVAGSSIVPRNKHQLLATDLPFLRGGVRTIDVATRVVAPSFLLNDAPFPTAPGQAGEIVLRGPGGGELSLGLTNEPTPPPLIAIEDTYAIQYRWAEGDQVPLNTARIVDYVALPEPGTPLALAIGGLGLLGASRSLRLGREATGAPTPAGR